MKRIIAYFTNKHRKSVEQRILRAVDAIFIIMKRNSMINGDSALNTIDLKHWTENWQDNGAKAKIEVEIELVSTGLKVCPICWGGGELFSPDLNNLIEVCYNCKGVGKI